MTVETARKVVVRRVLRGARLGTGMRKVGWNGRMIGGLRIYPGRYVLHVMTSNQFGPADMRRVVTIRRG